MLSRKTVWKKADDLWPGDSIISTIDGHAVFADRVNEVRHIRDGMVLVDVNCWTGTHMFRNDEQVLVSPALSA